MLLALLVRFFIAVVRQGSDKLFVFGYLVQVANYLGLSRHQLILNSSELTVADFREVCWRNLGRLHWVDPIRSVSVLQHGYTGSDCKCVIRLCYCRHIAGVLNIDKASYTSLWLPTVHSARWHWLHSLRLRFYAHFLDVSVFVQAAFATDAILVVVDLQDNLLLFHTLWIKIELLEWRWVGLLNRFVYQSNHFLTHLLSALKLDENISMSTSLEQIYVDCAFNSISRCVKLSVEKNTHVPTFIGLYLRFELLLHKLYVLDWLHVVWHDLLILLQLDLWSSFYTGHQQRV